jgi:hypothetical protein
MDTSPQMIIPTKKDPAVATRVQMQDPNMQLKILTFNIDGAISREKLNTIINCARSADQPDVLCLLNVKEQGFNYLSTELSNYVSFQVFISEGDEAGTVIMCNKKTVSISEQDQPYYFDYPRTPGRIIGTGIVHARSGLTFNVLTADVSPRNSRVQTETLFKVLDGIDNYILMGDLACIAPDLETRMKDTWTKMGCPNKIRCTNGDDRLTRIYYNSRILLPKAMSLVGTKIKLGDHYGLEATFKVVGKQTRKI